MLALVEQRDRALAALKELEFDHRTGKITDDDYRRELGPLRQAAAAALQGARLAGVGAAGGEVGCRMRSGALVVARAARRRDPGARRRRHQEASGRRRRSRRCRLGRLRTSTRDAAARRGRRLHEPHPRARGARRRRLAPPPDARERPLAAPAAPGRAQRALHAPVEPTRLPAGAVRGRGAGAQPPPGRHLRVRPAVVARRLPRRAERPGRARPGGVPDRHRRAGPADRERGRVREGASDGGTHEDEGAARPRPRRDGRDRGADDAGPRRARRARRRPQRPRRHAAAEADRPVAALEPGPRRRAGDRRAAGGERSAHRPHPRGAGAEHVGDAVVRRA